MKFSQIVNNLNKIMFIMTSHFHNDAFNFFEFLSTLASYSAAKIKLYLKTRIFLFTSSFSFQNLKTESKNLFSFRFY